MNRVEIDNKGVKIVYVDDNPTLPGLEAVVNAGMLTLFFGLDDLPDEGVEATIGLMVKMVSDLFTSINPIMANAFVEALETGDDSALLRFLPIEDREEEQC